jgi:two-component system, chemotaxis family, chemotaxis protein CheY
VSTITHARLTALHLRALIVDDSDSMRELLSRLLKRIGIDSTQFADGSAALSAVLSISPDFILTDLSMAPMDGLTFTKTLRKARDERARQIPIIMVTGFTERSKLEAARDSGISAVLAKPVTATTLYNRIEEVILRPRTFLNVPSYMGPCRRRVNNPYYVGPMRRSTDNAAAAGSTAPAAAAPADAGAAPAAPGAAAKV